MLDVENTKTRRSAMQIHIPYDSYIWGNNKKKIYQMFVLMVYVSVYFLFTSQIYILSNFTFCNSVNYANFSKEERGPRGHSVSQVESEHVKCHFHQKNKKRNKSQKTLLLYLKFKQQALDTNEIERSVLYNWNSRNVTHA